MRAAFQISSLDEISLRALNYSPFVEAFRNPRKNQSSFRIRDVVGENGVSYGYSFARRDCSPEYGIELLSQSDTFASEPAGRWILSDHNPRADRHRIRKWDIVTAGVGTLGETELYGRSIIADDRLVGRYVGDSLILRCKDPGSTDNLYLYAFLCTSIGVSVLRATSCGTKQLRFLRTLLMNAYVPNADPSVKKVIAGLIETTAEKRGIYLKEIRAARQIIDELPEVDAVLKHCESRKHRFNITHGPFITICARNHASLGNARSVFGTQWKSKIADLVEPNGILGKIRFARVPCKKPHGIDFLDQKDIFAIRPVPRRIVEQPMRKDLIDIPQNTLLIAANGQLSEGTLFGRVETAAFGYFRSGITEHILRVIPKPEYHDFLLAFLSSKIGLHLLKSTAVGTSIPMMHLGLFAAIPCPILGSTKHAAVAKHVQASNKARGQADAAEQEAVRIIEQEVLPSWLA